jgi:hypothetical protein
MKKRYTATNCCHGKPWGECCTWGCTCTEGLPHPGTVTGHAERKPIALVHGLESETVLNGALVEVLSGLEEHTVKTASGLDRGPWHAVSVIALAKGTKYVPPAAPINGYLRPQNLNFDVPAVTREVLESKIFAPRVAFEDLKTFLAFWQDYEATAVPPQAGEEQRNATYNSFLAGAWAFISLQDLAVIQSFSEDVAEARVMNLREEVKRLIDTGLAGGARPQKKEGT